jgi:hypothetical protein
MQPPEDVVPDWPMPVLSSTVAATLRVVDFTCCSGMTSIDAVRSCVQLRVMWMPYVGVSDLSLLAACSETLEELWMSGNEQIDSLVPLKACTRLAKLDLFGCNLDGQVEDLRQACPQLADPSTAEVEGLVHELQPGIPPHNQAWAAYGQDEIINLGGPDYLVNIAAAGAIPPCSCWGVALRKLCRWHQHKHLPTWRLGMKLTRLPSLVREQFHLWCGC